MAKMSALIIILSFFFINAIPTVSRAEPVNLIDDSFKVLKVYGDLETDTVQPWMQLYNGRCVEACQNEFNKCIESRAVRKSCDRNLYKITGVYTYEFPCGENEIWLMEFSSACKTKGGPDSPTAEFTGHIACVARDMAKQCETAGDGCAVDCKNSSKIDRDLSVTIPTATKKQYGIVRPGLNSLDIRRE